MQTTHSVTPLLGDLEEELSHGGTNNVASPANYSAIATAVTCLAPQAVGGQGYVAANLGVQFEEEIMSYPYPKYSNHPDARSHVKQFRFIWAVNHNIQ